MPSTFHAAPAGLQDNLKAFLSLYPDEAGQIAAVKAALEGPERRFWRAELGKWSTQLVPVEELVPAAYSHWRPLVRDAMEFVVSRLSADRLAPKVIEQIQLPAGMPAEIRLLRLITRVPGLQKIGQVLARNRHFQPRFRRALSQLENGISDATVEQIRGIIASQLGPQIEAYRVKLATRMLSEASVSAVLGFTWRNPHSGRRERGVFKVLKPHIPGCFEEDMRTLQQLAKFLSRKYRKDRSRFAGLAETLAEVRLLLGHEVDFRREQATLPEAGRVYGSIPGVRVPAVIEPLSTDSITAMTYEPGAKVTDAARRHPASRAKLAEQLVYTIVGVPALSRQEKIIFHADPHAGNLLYDNRPGELVMLDWALTGHLRRDQRRNIILLVLSTILRDPDRIRRAVEQLREHGETEDIQQARAVRKAVRHFITAMPLAYVPGPMDAMRLLDDMAREGIRFPASLAMFRKAAFTLEGVVEDVAGTEVRLDLALANHALAHWIATGASLASLLSPRDWLALQWSALTFGSRFFGQAALRPLHWLVEPNQAMAAEPTSG